MGPWLYVQPTGPPSGAWVRLARKAWILCTPTAAGKPPWWKRLSAVSDPV